MQVKTKDSRWCDEQAAKAQLLAENFLLVWGTTSGEVADRLTRLMHTGGSATTFAALHELAARAKGRRIVCHDGRLESERT